MYQKSQSYDIRFLRYGVTDRIFCHFRPFFIVLPPYHLLPPPLMTSKIKILKKKTKTKNEKNDQRYNHMIYDCWNIRCDRQKFLSFWTIFCPFSPLTTWKIKIFTLKKNTWRYYHFTHLHHTRQSYDVWFLRYGVHQTIFCPSGPFFALLPLYEPIKSNFEKNEKKNLKILSFYKCAP